MVSGEPIAPTGGESDTVAESDSEPGELNGRHETRRVIYRFIERIVIQTLHSG